MAIQVAPRKQSLNNVSFDPSNKQEKLSKLRESLDNIYSERDVMRNAQNLGLDYVNLYGKPIDTSDLTLISEDDARKYNAGVFIVKNKEISLATPQLQENQKELIQSFIKQKYTVKLFLCSKLSFEKLLEKYKHSVFIKNVQDDISITEEMSDILSSGVDSLDGLEEKLRRVPTSDFVNIILIAALKNNASDIHFEPQKEFYELRLRLDGILYTFGKFDKDIQRRVESRIKILSGLKLNIDNVPQDGRFSFNYEGRDIDVRVSMLPSNYGYSIVARLLGTGSVELQLNSLGFTGENKLRVEKAVAKHQGMILATGPTGSGKTTTLYTFLNSLNDGATKIITLEDPIEYKLAGISQTQIDEEAGYTFASGLRSILRQDPDVVMVGEIRDKETSSVAVQAALTGHKVLSTLHTNDAVGAVSRFMELEIEGYMIADSVAGIIGQRLIRRLCPRCKKPHKLEEGEQKLIEETISNLPENAKNNLPENLEFYTSVGCDKCNNVGYKGRIGVYEVLTMTDGVRQLLVSERPSFVDIRKTAREEGMITMREDAVLKALDGLTDIKEIIRGVD